MILQNLDALEKDLKSSADRSCYVVLGPEEYLCRLAIERIKKAFLNSEGAAFDFSSFSIREASVNTIFETANTFPMISRRRVVLVTDLERLSENDSQKFLDSLEGLLSRSTMILSAGELDRRKKFYKTLRDKGCVIEFPKMKGPALQRWVEAFVKKRGYRISSAMAGKIVNLAGSDLQSLVGELEKLLLYSGSEKTISEESVDDLVRNSRQQGIFELIDAIGMRDRPGALASLANLLGMGEYPPRIVSMMARHSRQVLIVKDCLERGMNPREAGSTAQVPPFMIDKFVRQARAMDSETVRCMHTGLYDIDRRFKSTSIDERALLEIFICALV